MSLTKEDVMSVKARGFLRNRGTDCFSGRVVSIGGVFSADQLRALADCAQSFGNGNVIFTSRLSAEIPGIAYEKIPEAEFFLKERDLYFGGTGAKVRPVTACKGSTCVFGLIDTHALARVIHERFYVGMKDVKLPHKFKIGVGGCPNSCMKPSLNDVGIEGCRAQSAAMCRVYVGGTWGKTQRMGTLLDGLYTEEQVPDLIEKVMLWYKENGYAKERLGAVVDRLGKEALEKAIEGEDLVVRRNEILAAPIFEQ